MENFVYIANYWSGMNNTAVCSHFLRICVNGIILALFRLLKNAMKKKVKWKSNFGFSGALFSSKVLNLTNAGILNKANNCFNLTCSKQKVFPSTSLGKYQEYK